LVEPIESGWTGNPFSFGKACLRHISRSLLAGGDFNRRVEMKTCTSLIMVATVALAIPAFAQIPLESKTKAQPQSRADVAARVKARFAMLDTDRDGAVVQPELAAMRDKKMAEMRDQHFKAMDTNQDGSISRAEFDAAHGTGADRPPTGDRMDHGPGHKGHARGGQGAMKMDRGPMGGGRMLERVDTNKDGKVTEAEMVAGALAKFDAADANKDGVLTPDERRAARQAMRAKRGASMIGNRDRLIVPAGRFCLTAQEVIYRAIGGVGIFH
jgi:hypothetical protein